MSAYQAQVRQQAARSSGCKPIQTQLRGVGGIYAFGTSGRITVLLGYAVNSLGRTGAQHGYIRSCTEPFGGNTPSVPDGYALDWEGIISTDANVGVTFGPAKRTMSFSGSGLSAGKTYTLFEFAADPQLSWEPGASLSLGAPVNHALSAPSLLQNGYSLTGSGLFFILAHERA